MNDDFAEDLSAATGEDVHYDADNFAYMVDINGVSYYAGSADSDLPVLLDGIEACSIYSSKEVNHEELC